MRGGWDGVEGMIEGVFVCVDGMCIGNGGGCRSTVLLFLFIWVSFFRGVFYHSKVVVSWGCSLFIRKNFTWLLGAFSEAR